MKLRPPNLEIPADDPFKHDVLDRLAAAETMTNLLLGCDEPLVISLNAPWGFGKTTFIEMLRKHLENKGIHSLYLNAWENDFSSDAFLTLLGDIDLAIRGLGANTVEKSEIDLKLDQARSIGKKIIKAAIPTAIKIATYGAIDLTKDTEDALSDLTEKIAEEQIKHYEEAKKSVAKFRTRLSELADAVSGLNNGEIANPMVIFVDELDRCRPPYVVSYLESIKHFFSVPNIVFIVALDKTQLGHSIKSLYGTSMDVEGYLKRFIDIDFNLPFPDYEKFVVSLFSKFGFSDFFAARTSPSLQHDHRQSVTALTELARALNLSLRELERSCTSLALAAKSTPHDFHIYPLLLLTLIGLKIKNPSLYGKFVTNQCDHSEVLEFLRETEAGRKFLDTHYGMVVEAHLVSCHVGRHKDAELVSIYSEIAQSTDSSELKRNRALQISKILNDWTFRESYGTLGYLTKKIDLLTPGERI
ncbi:MAG: P-loop NTPase fold protein [Pseudomonadota bacterium]